MVMVFVVVVCVGTVVVVTVDCVVFVDCAIVVLVVGWRDCCCLRRVCNACCCRCVCNFICVVIDVC